MGRDVRVGASEEPEKSIEEVRFWAKPKVSDYNAMIHEGFSKRSTLKIIIDTDIFTYLFIYVNRANAFECSQRAIQQRKLLRTAKG